MARTKAKWSAIFAGPPELVAQHVEFPLTILEEPDRPLTATMPLSSVRRLVKALAIIESRYMETRDSRTTPGWFDDTDAD